MLLLQRSRIGIVALSILLTACFGQTAEPEVKEGATEGTSSANTEEVRETKNVFYRGTVQPAGISIYMQGTHKLVLPDGRFLLLESDSLDLNGYVDEEVEVFGATRPTVEAGGIIMRVERISLVGKEEKDTEEASEAEEQSEVAGETGDTIAPAIEPPAVTTPEKPAEEPSRPIPERPPATEEAEEEAVAEPEEAEREPLPVEMQTKVAAMARQNLSAENWTSEYCSPHIGFCIPMHRNWWFHSFGATTYSLWHVEIGPEEIENFGEGPMVVKLLSGAVESKKALNGQVRPQGALAVVFRTWTKNRHFTITAPTALEGAVQHIVDHLAPYEPPEDSSS